jgi:hypothetical protein
VSLVLPGTRGLGAGFFSFKLCFPTFFLAPFSDGESFFALPMLDAVEEAIQVTPNQQSAPLVSENHEYIPLSALEAIVTTPCG